MESINWVEVSAIIIAALVAVALIVLLKRGLVSETTITAAGDLLDTIPVYPEDGFVGQLFTYARLAVRAVEQMTKSGDIPWDNQARKTEAMAQAQLYAKIDGLELGDADRAAISDLIEAAVLELPKSEPEEV